jgi:hypothetical protein
LLAQPTGQVMPSTVKQTSVEALASAVEAVPAELVGVLAELPTDFFAAEGSDSPHPASATLSAMNTGADR